MAQPPNFKFVDKLRLPCSKCGRPLLLTRIEREERGFDLRIHYCAGCGSNEAVIAPVGMVGISARLQDS